MQFASLHQPSLPFSRSAGSTRSSTNHDHPPPLPSSSSSSSSSFFPRPPFGSAIVATLLAALHSSAFRLSLRLPPDGTEKKNPSIPSSLNLFSLFRARSPPATSHTTLYSLGLSSHNINRHRPTDRSPNYLRLARLTQPERLIDISTWIQFLSHGPLLS